ncbi:MULTISPECIES: bifunctional phosphoribosyl-AMP cyclohydrolase/phosphoribosyl-ATP diphosphatase HisIE [Legionella]|uniref:Histidine biosynthesis bifunctional protein HisIE n=1 Tax=Legionella maceachernii TaxID=466 RepID=A0A0W0VYU9_9GAMM|nr:bifunctional phosphoribosyl-AMP cyclohydrolase/phosphoribosyl-ATP diphosphatase HisIE [Legionella maceachernii]KTD25226.1 bifunctional phosphoribosyl-AMP cyclohydrolase/phosphoribosyl-ATP pyrophosphatase protein [Legionella maceachernii]SJZ76820.1 phosphoribosyl-ATP pyrophosphatase /phosphoribosyl-AMP cyclohydrolase [Legionella maceachernii]SUP03082.1 Phosphoribosyl-ATP pyrophosphatase [Legionella maceachernii]
MNTFQIEQLDWQKMNGLIPAIVQHANSGEVLMLGYMNREALQMTLQREQVTFYSRSKQRLWTKGESSSHFMRLKAIATDCDGDSLLIQVIPEGPACHLGFTSCFQPGIVTTLGFIDHLIKLIQNRAKERNTSSYTAQLLASGINRCAQKVGEEAVETVIAAVTHNRDELLNEAADLVFHLLVMLQACELSFYELLACLQERH